MFITIDSGDLLISLLPILQVKQRLPKALLIGPDSGYKDAEEWLKDYLTLVHPDANGNEPQTPFLHAVTHHVYDAPGKTEFNSPSGLNSGLAEIGDHQSLQFLVARTLNGRM